MTTWQPGDEYVRWGIGWAGPRSPVTVGGRSLSTCLLPSWQNIDRDGPYGETEHGIHDCGFNFWVPFESQLAAEVWVNGDGARGYLRWSFPRTRRELENWDPPGPAHCVRRPGGDHRYVEPATWDAEVEVWHPLSKTVDWMLGDPRMPDLHGPTEFDEMVDDWRRLARWRRDTGPECSGSGRVAQHDIDREAMTARCGTCKRTVRVSDRFKMEAH